ncbi:hypothetical protein Tco_1214199 [Tanacetum coccineum]
MRIVLLRPRKKADVPEIYMQQFWYTVKKIQNTSSYEFDLANKKCKVDVEVFRQILGICLRAQGEDFAYKAFIDYSTGVIPPKKTICKASQGKKQAVTPKKKSSIYADDNIIPEPDVALELGKFISRTEAKDQEEARQVHETYERLVTEKPASEEDSDEPANRPTRRRRTSGIVFRDISRVSKKKSLDHSQKLKGIQVLTVEEQLATDTMQAIKASKMVIKSRPHTGGSSKGASITPEVPDESTFIFTTSSERIGITLGVPNEVSSDEEEEKQDDQDDDDDRSINIEETDDEDEYVHGDEYVHNDMNEEMKDGENVETRKDDEEITDAENTDAERSEETKGDYEKVRKHPPISSILYVSSGFGNQFLNLSSDTFIVSTTKEYVDTKINALMDIQIQ